MDVDVQPRLGVVQQVYPMMAVAEVVLVVLVGMERMSWGSEVAQMMQQSWNGHCLHVHGEVSFH